MTAQPADFYTIDIVPLVMARPVYAPPPVKHDPPLFAYWCPYSRAIKLIAEEITLWPASLKSECGRPIVLQRGSAIFIGPHLLAGYPDQLSPKLPLILKRLYDDDLKYDYEERWLINDPIRTNFKLPPRPRVNGKFVSMTTGVKEPDETGNAEQIAIVSPSVELVNASVGNASVGNASVENEEGKAKVTTNA